MKQVRIEVDCTASNYFVEIDAVQLRGKKYMSGEFRDVALFYFCFECQEHVFTIENIKR